MRSSAQSYYGLAETVETQEMRGIHRENQFRKCLHLEQCETVNCLDSETAVFAG